MVGDAGQSNWYMWNSVPIGRVDLVQPIPFDQSESPKVLAMDGVQCETIFVGGNGVVETQRGSHLP